MFFHRTLRFVAGCFVLSLLACAATGTCYADEAPATTRAESRQILHNVVKEASELRAAGKSADAVKVYEAAFATANKAGPGADAAAVLADALRSSQTIAADDVRAGRLLLGAREALVALDFKPVVEADLPAGFPPPGAVGEVTVKTYPAYRAARTPMAGGARNSSFFTLFNHIQSNQIAMTAPVEMTYGRRSAPPGADAVPDGKAVEAKAMAFLYASPDLGRAGPADNVDVVDIPAMTTVSIGVRGPYTDDRMNKSLATLRHWLDQHRDQYAEAGDPRYLGYNSPMVPPWFQFGEVQIPVREVKSTD